MLAVRTLVATAAGMLSRFFRAVLPAFAFALLLMSMQVGTAIAQAIGDPSTSIPSTQPPPGTNYLPPPDDGDPPPPPSPYDAATGVSISAPSIMAPGSTAYVTVTIRNSGTTTWYPGLANPYRIGSQNPQDNKIWGLGRVDLGSTVAPGGQAVFGFTITAPSTAGTYTFGWAMLREAMYWFGGNVSSTITVAVPPPVYDAQLVSASVPTSMTAGGYYNVSMTFKNTGNTTWTSPDFLLGNTDNNYTFGANRASMSSSSVAPGQSSSFTFRVQAPTTTGTYTFQWGMLWELHQRFGQSSTTNITVSAPVTPKPTITPSHTAMVAGSSFTMSWSTTNATSLSHVCSASGTGYTVNESLAVSGSRSIEAQSSWVNYPSTCTWMATGPGGTTTVPETLTTAAAPTPKPTISPSHTAMVAGQSFTMSWSTTNATSLTHVCTASGTGYTVNESLALSGTRSIAAQSSWVNYPSTCTWTATGPGGTTTVSETLTTSAASTPKPTINVQRPSLVAGQSFTTTWSTTDATSLTHVCTASGTGYTVNESLAVNGSRALTAQSIWIGYPSSCTWTASGAGGSTTYTETMTTVVGVNNSVTYIHTDGLGSPVARTDSSGAVISRTRYEPYGYVASGVQPTIGFTGHVNDVDTGLTYMQQRYYDPVAGRFLSIDPVVADANTGGSFNRYTYANNSPYKYVDPDGRDSCVAQPGGGQTCTYTGRSQEPTATPGLMDRIGLQL